MDVLKYGSMSFGAISIALAIVGTSLLLLDKLTPDRRRSPDRPKVWVPAGYWSYVGIHYLLVYCWYTADFLVIEKQEYNYADIIQGTNVMLTNSKNGLEHLPPLKLMNPILNMKTTDITEKIKSQLGFDDVIAAHNDFNANAGILSNEKAKINEWIGNINNSTCQSELTASFEKLNDEIKRIDQIIPSVLIDSANDQKIAIVVNDLEQSFGVDNLSKVGQKAVENSLKIRKEVLSHFSRDMMGVEEKRKNMLAVFKPMITDKFELIKIVTFVEIFLSLAISMLIYLGFSRFQWMSERWAIRVCAVAIVLSGINLIIFSSFTIWLGTFKCPIETANIDHLQFTTDWKNPISGSVMKICAPGQLTIFDKIDDQISISKEFIIEMIENDMEEIGEIISTLTIDSEGVTATFGEVRKILKDMKGHQHCLTAETDELAGIWTKLLAACDNIEDVVGKSNELFLLKTAPIQTLIDFFYEDARRSLINSINEFESKLNSADIGCKMIEWKFGTAGQRMCDELDAQLNLHWLILDVSLFFLVTLFCLNVFVFRSVSLWFLEQRKKTDKKNKFRPSPVQGTKHRGKKRLSNVVF